MVSIVTNQYPGFGQSVTWLQGYCRHDQIMLRW